MEGQYIIQQAGRQEEEDDDGPREGELREQDRFLPIYNISKVMKKVVPHSGKVAKEARECVQECVSEFISFITRWGGINFFDWKIQPSQTLNIALNLLVPTSVIPLNLRWFLKTILYLLHLTVRQASDARRRKGRRSMVSSFCLLSSHMMSA